MAKEKVTLTLDAENLDIGENGCADQGEDGGREPA